MSIVSENQVEEIINDAEVFIKNEIKIISNTLNIYDNKGNKEFLLKNLRNGILYYNHGDIDNILKEKYKEKYNIDFKYYMDNNIIKFSDSLDTIINLLITDEIKMFFDILVMVSENYE